MLDFKNIFVEMLDEVIGTEVLKSYVNVVSTSLKPSKIDFVLRLTRLHP